MDSWCLEIMVIRIKIVIIIMGMNRGIGNIK
jgi:hypothetical protein